MPFGKFSTERQRKFLKAEAAAFADVIGLNKLGAFAEHLADRIESTTSSARSHRQREQAEGAKRDNAQADTLVGRGQKPEAHKHNGSTRRNETMRRAKSSAAGRKQQDCGRHKIR